MLPENILQAIQVHASRDGVARQNQGRFDWNLYAMSELAIQHKSNDLT